MNTYKETKEYTLDSIFSTQAYLPEHLSARQTLCHWQVSLVSVLLGSWFLWFLHDGIGALTLLIFCCMLSVLSVCAYKVLMVTLSIMANSSTICVTPKDLAILDEKVLPLYTILVPFYKEARVLPNLINALLMFDYPADRLDIILLLEADDEETIAAITRIPLPSYFRILIIPAGYPRTKPRACNVGLKYARGKFLVIYDAEDQPDPDQLKKAVIAFQRSDEKVICIQSRLNFYNPRQNLLTCLFTLEYSFWFDLLLPGLSTIGAPIPLGGTSNHFQTAALKAMGGWDAFNVAEDCDLGIRLAVAGYQTLIMNSTTWEEANSQIPNWLRQRSRWTKGYLQTYLVHMRDPLRLLQILGFRDFLSFQLIVGGTPIVLLLAPIFWLLILAYYIFQLEPIQQFRSTHFLGYLDTLGHISLVFSNLSFLYLGICGAVVRGNYDLIQYVLLSPIYYALQSVAAWKGCFQLLTNPHYWEKTIHGLSPVPLVRNVENKET
jgi:cellulose synthase/poly-beta-1,6-N-acetylglucosamine synthase-like glycosyltransferase